PPESAAGTAQQRGTKHDDSFYPPSSSDWHRPLRNLHSFPTRRSSDLARPGKTPGVERPDLLHRDGRLLVVLRHRHRHVRRLDLRSEEHTSELQSPCNLVCRLLLEKKKTEVRSIGTLAGSHLSGVWSYT